MVDGPLQVVHTTDLLDGAKDAECHLLVAHPDHSQSHRPEQRLDDDIAERPEGGHGLLRVVADDGFRSGDAALLQQGRGPELVDRALDGPRRVHHPDSAVLQAVQGIHPEDDLLQRA